mgnify:CR=1 FL=1|jgi:hypothetical protein
MQLTKEEILDIEKTKGRQLELRRHYNRKVLSVGAATPTDPIMYAAVKKSIYNKITKHSAYRSGRVVAAYKKSFKKKYGAKKSPYKGKKNKNKGLSRWFKERWRNQRGGVGYKKKGDVYRPTRRITKKTPRTHRELSQRQIKKAMWEKKKKGRVSRFGSKKKKKRVSSSGSKKKKKRK